MKRAYVLTSVVAALFVAACSSTGAGEDGFPAPRRGSRNVIGTEELQEVVVTNAFDAVQRLRPAWLRPRGGAGLPAAFRDGIKIGDDVQMLQQVAIENVLEIRFISANDATTRWGTGYTGGVIQVITRR